MVKLFYFLVLYYNLDYIIYNKVGLIYTYLPIILLNFFGLF